MIREAKEETGLDVVPLRCLDRRQHTYDFGVLELEFWHCELVDPTTRQATHQQFRWHAITDLGDLPFPAANQHAIQVLIGERQT